MSTAPVLYRPDPECPDVDTPEAGRLFHYRTPDGRRLYDAAYLYEYPGNPELLGWYGAAGVWMFPDGFSPSGPATWEHIRGRIEERLREAGFAIADRPAGWAPPVPVERFEYRAVYS